MASSRHPSRDEPHEGIEPASRDEPPRAGHSGAQPLGVAISLLPALDAHVVDEVADSTADVGSDAKG